MAFTLMRTVAPGSEHQIRHRVMYRGEMLEGQITPVDTSLPEANSFPPDGA